MPTEVFFRAFWAFYTYFCQLSLALIGEQDMSLDVLPGGREVGLIRDFTERGVQTETPDAVTVLGERFEDDSLVDVPAWLERAAVLSVQPGNLAGVLSVHHAQLRVLVDVALQRSQHYGEVSVENICYYRTMSPFLGFM